MIVNKHTKIGHLVNNYPWLVEALPEVDSRFVMLKHKTALSTLGNVTTIETIAAMVHITVDEFIEMVNKLIKERGQTLVEFTTDEQIERVEILKTVIIDIYKQHEHSEIEPLVRELLKDLEPCAMKQLKEKLASEGIQESWMNKQDG